MIKVAVISMSGAGVNVGTDCSPKLRVCFGPHSDNVNILVIKLAVNGCLDSVEWE